MALTRRTRAIRIAAVLSLCAAALATRDARAAEERAVVVLGDGTDGEEVASRVGSHLAAPYAAKDAGPLRRALTGAHAPSLALAAKESARDTKLVNRVWLALRGAHVSSAVLVHVRRSKRAVSAHVWLVETGGDGAATVDREVTLPASAGASEVSDAVWNAVASSLSSSSATDAVAPPPPASVESAKTADSPSPVIAPSPPPPAPSPRPSEEQPVHESDPSQRRRGREEALFAVRVLLEAGTRHFSYVDRLTTTLRSYDLLAAPLVGVDGAVYPLARTRVAVLKDLGITGDYRLAFALSSSDSSGASVSTSWSAFDVGARERIHLNDSAVLGVHGGYGQNDYTFSGALGQGAKLPDASYHFVSGGIDADLALARLSLYVSASYLGVLSTGTVGTYFPRATVGGVEGALGAAYAIVGGLEVSIEVAYTRFFYSMNPQPGDAYVAGGALDQMGQGAVGVGYVF
jgi:hypothetical protein